MLDLLRKVRGFAGLDDTLLGLIQALLQPAEYKQDDRLCTEGEEGDKMFIIASGEIAVLKEVDEGEMVEVSTLTANDIAGEMGLLGSKLRTATLVASTDSQVLTLSYSDFDNLISQHGDIAKGLLAYVSGKLERETSVVAKLIARDMEKGLRIAFFHTSPYRNALYSQKNQFKYAMHFFEPRLSIDTVPLAAGFSVIVVSANDTVDTEVVEELHSLGIEMIALRCAGFNNVDIETCERLGISVARVPAYSPYAVAEHAVALMMALNRSTHRAHNRIREVNFSLDGLVGFDMHGRTAGIVGTGKIGVSLIKILHGFGCQLLAYSRTVRPELEEEFGVRFVDLDTLFSQSDIISLHAPLTPRLTT